VDAIIKNGVVTLTGSVTGERNKAEEIAEEVARVRGVQDIVNQIIVAPPSQGDDRIRDALYTRVFSNMHFDRFESVKNPPFRMVVHNGVVTLYGFVQGELERRELESLARFTAGVLRVENRLRTIAKPAK
jgi:osmotically-inducible protein OsmY